MLYEMHAGHAPFVDDDPMWIYQKILNAKPRYPNDFDDNLKSLVRHLLRRDLSKRYGSLTAGAGDIKNHRALAGINFQELLNKTLPAPY